MDDQTVSLKLEGDASDLQQALNESGQAMDDLSGQAESAASDIESSVSGASSAWDEHSGKINAAAAAMGIAGASLEGFARSQQDATVDLARTSTVTGILSDDLRELAADTANVTFSTEDVIGTFHTLGRQGVRTEEDLQRVANVWDLVADATGENVVALAESSVALRTLGIDANEPEQALDALGFITTETTGSVQEFLTFVERTGPELRDLGLDVDDTAAVLAILEQEFGMSGRVARQEFRQAVNEADGSLEAMLETLGVAPERFEDMRGQVDGSSDALHANAEALEESFTPLQRLSAWLEETALRYGGLADTAGMLSPVLMGAGGAVFAINQAIQAKATLATTAGRAAGGVRGLTAAYGPFAIAALAAVDAVQHYNHVLGESREETAETDRTFREFVDSQNEAGFGWHIVTDAVKDSIMPWRAAARNAGELTHAIELLGNGSSDTADEVPELTDEVANLTDAEKSARQHIDAANDVLDEQADAAQDTADEFLTASDAIDIYIDSVRRATDPVFALIDAVDRVDEAQRSHTEAVNEFGEDSPEAAEAAIDLAKEIANLERAALDGDLSFAEFESQLNTWVDQGTITEGQADDIRRGIEGAVEAADRFEGTRSMVFEAHGLGQVVGQMDRLPTGTIRALASGGRMHHGELALVGEEGPELVRATSGPVDVHSTADTADILGQATAGPTSHTAVGGSLSVTVNAGFGSDGDSIADAVVSAITRYERDNGSVPIRVG